MLPNFANSASIIRRTVMKRLQSRLYKIVQDKPFADARYLGEEDYHPT